MTRPGRTLLARRWLRRHRRSLNLRRLAGDRVGEVMRLALPAVGEQLLNMSVGLVDTFLVGHLGAASIAAVSISNQIVMLAYTVCSSIATGSTALIARSIGAEDHLTANRTVRQTVFIGAILGLLTTTLGMLFAPQLARIMGATDDALLLAATYLGIVSLTFLFSTWMFVGTACLRGAGRTMVTMRIMMLVNAINIVVAWVLIYGPFGLPKLGVAGSAIGAATARAVGGVVVLGILWRGRSGLRLDLARFRPDLEIIRRVLRVGIPTGVEMLLFRLGDMSYFRVVTTLGMTVCAAHAVALNAQSLSFSPGFGFSIAATALVGQGLGALQPKRAESDGYLAYKIGGAIMGAMGLVFVLFSGRIIGVFTNDSQVIALGAGPLRLVGLFQPFLASTMIFSGALRGAGDTRFPMVSNGTSVFVVRFGLAMLFVQVLGLGLMGAWYAMVVDMSLRGTLAFIRFRLGHWKRVEV